MGDLLEDRVVLLALGAIDLVVVVNAHHRTVGRDLADAHLVDVVEFLGLGGGRAGHAGQFAVEAEIVLDRHRGQGLVLGLDVGAFLGLDGLVQAFREAAAGHHATGELIDQDDFVVLDDVVLVQGVEHVGAQGLVDVVHDRDVGGVIEAGAVLGQVAARHQDLFDALLAVLGEDDLLLLLVVIEVGLVLDELLHQDVDGLVELAAVLGRARDDQRGAGLVDQDRVHFVDDHVVVAALDHFLDAVDEVVAQVVEAEFVVGAVGDVAAIGALTFTLAQAVDDHAIRQAQEVVDLTHPVGVAAGQIVVDGDDVDALALERVEVGGQGGDQGLALAGAHFRDAAGVQDHAADHLDVEVAHAQHALAGLADHGEGLGQQAVQRLALGQASLELFGLGLQGLVGQGGVFRLQGVDLRHLGGHRLDLAFVGRAEELFGEAEHEYGIRSGVCEAGARA